MKILLTSDWPVSAVNGVAISIMNLYKELKKLGHDVKVLSLSDNSDFYKDGDFYYVKSFEIHIYPEVRATLHFHNKYVNELVKWKPDIVHSQCEFFTYSIANTIAARSSCPIVHTYHTLYEHYTSYVLANEKITKPLLHQLIKWRLKDADLVIAPTEKVYSRLEGLVNGHIEIMPTGIDLSKYDNPPDQLEISKLKEKYNIPRDKKILLSLGRVGKEKNYDESIDNFNKLLKVRDDVIFMIVGDGPYLPEVKENVKRLAIQDKVIFTGLIKPSETVKYYSIADIFISASVSETQGLTYIEALANGLPEVCRHDDALIGVVENGYNGYLYEDSQGYIEAINILLDNEDILKQMAMNAKESSEKFSMKYFGENAERIYKLALEDFKPRHRLTPAKMYENLVDKGLLAKIPLDKFPKIK